MPSSDLKFEIGHVLFMDIVGYSKLVIDHQTDLTRKLNEIARNAPQFRRAEAEGTLVRLPTGDGIALVFRNHPEAPAQCALEISTALRAHPEIEIRMGIHSGPVNETQDVNDRANIAGAGINIAQRVMDCGDAGHILLSKRVADDLANYARWLPHLHDLGEAEVKHGLRVHLVSLFGDGFGNPELPTKLKQTEQARIGRARRRRKWQVVGAAIFIAVLFGSALWFYTHPASRTPPVATAPAIPEKSIAVLPFENLSAEKDDAFFADGIQDDVLTSLGRIKELTVIARASVMTYRGAAVTGKLREIGQTLRVSHVLEGSVRRSANRVVINVELIDTRDDRQVWSERYERTLTDTLTLQGELAVEIARELQATLTPSEKTIVATKPTENPDAYLLYLRARAIETHFWPSDADFEPAIHLFQQAINLDPKFALARARLSLRMSYLSRDPKNSPAAKARARAEADEALRLQPQLGEAWLASAYCYYTKKEYDHALKELSRAGELMPNSAEVLQVTSYVYGAQEKFRERIAVLHRAEILDPRDPNVMIVLAYTSDWVRDWQEAARARDRINALLPNEPKGRVWWARAYDEYQLTGDAKWLRKAIADAPSSANPDEVDESRFELATIERDYPAMETFLRAASAKVAAGVVYHNNYTGYQAKMEEAFLAVARGGRTAAERALNSTRVEIENYLQVTPNDSEAHTNLGIVHAFLGRKADAIREGQRGVELASRLIQKNEASAGLALIHAQTGGADEAVTLIEHLLTVSTAPFHHSLYVLTLTNLKRGWQWDPLRSNPRFQKLLAQPEPKTIY